MANRGEKVVPLQQPAELRTMPYNEEAEMALLGCILWNNRAFERVGDFLMAEHFAVEIHRRIYDVIGKLIGRGVSADPRSVKQYFDQDNSLHEVGGSAYLGKLAASVLTIQNVENYARIIYELWQRRELINLAREALEAAYNSDPASASTSHDLIETIENGLYRLAEQPGEQRQSVSAADAVQESLSAAAAAQERGGGLAGVPTGLVDLDRKLGGLRAGSFYVLGARPSMGKTALAGAIAFNAASAGHRTVIYELEMTRGQLGSRIAAPLVGLSPFELELGRVTDEQWSALSEVQQQIARLPLEIDDRSSRTVAQILVHARRLKRRGGLALIIIDHIGLLKAAPELAKENGTWQVGKTSNALKSLAKELDVPVLCLAQLNRANEARDNKRPTLADFRQSGEIEQDADVAMGLYREVYYKRRSDKPRPNAGEPPVAYLTRKHDWERACNDIAHDAELEILKHRGGPIGTVDLHFDETTTRFCNAAKEEDYRP